MNTIAITGATGFIGKNLLKELLRLGDFRLKVLSRNKNQYINDLIELDVEVIEGDLLDPGSLNGFLDEGCIVVNLVYLWDGGVNKNVVAINNLVHACKSAGVRRLIHCSTAAVVGRVHDSVITENTLCRPITDYGITKFKIEQIILRAGSDHLDVVVLRPTAVFGIDGEPIKKLANDLITKSWIFNYLKSCLFNRRQMNLVHISNVIAAFTFLINRPENFMGAIFIVSDDASPNNNYYYVERFLMREIGIPNYILPRINMPKLLLILLLKILGRNNVNPICTYSSHKLLSLGFKKALSFEQGLADYAAWYKISYIASRES